MASPGVHSGSIGWMDTRFSVWSMGMRQNNPWMHLNGEQEDVKTSKGIVPLLQLLLMGYGAYCLISKSVKILKRFFGNKELPMHDA